MSQIGHRKHAEGSKLTPRLVESIALASFVTLLVFLTGFSAWVAVTTYTEADALARVAVVRDAWSDARFAAATAESLNRRYRLGPSPDIAAQHRRVSDDLDRALASVLALDTDVHAAALSGIHASHARYLDAAERMFAAADAGNLEEANRIGAAETHPAFAAIEGRVYQMAALHDEELQGRVLNLERVTGLVLTTTLVVAAVGLVVMTVLALIFRWYRRKIRDGETRLRLLLAQTSEVILLLDEDGMVTYQGPSASRAWGVDDGALLNRPVVERLHHEDRSIVNMTLLQMLISPTTTATHEMRVCMQDGSYRDFEVTFRNHLEARGLNGIVTTWHDITARKLAETSIRASEEQYRRIAETSYEGILMSNVEGVITFGNERLCEMFGYPLNEVVGQHAITFVAPQSRDLVIAKMQASRVESRQHYEAALVHSDGSIRWATISASSLFDDDGEFQGRLAMISDITERRRAEEELYQAQKLESVGRLAAGIAHEINTPIQFIGDNVHFLRDGFSNLETVARAAQALAQAADTTTADAMTSSDLLAQLREAEEAADLDYLADEVPRAIEQTLDGVQRVATIVRAMKEFAHPDEGDMSIIDINQALRSTLTVVRNEVKYVADVETAFGELPYVTCHPSALNQVFLNLLVNAAHAIGDRMGQEDGYTRGTVYVRTSVHGERVLIEIEDTGCGIPEAIRTRVFEQFFTTKAVGRGTGQGLALARRVVVEQHGGSITFASEVGKGTTFMVWLPIEQAEPPEASIVGMRGLFPRA